VVGTGNEMGAAGLTVGMVGAGGRAGFNQSGNAISGIASAGASTLCTAVGIGAGVNGVGAAVEGVGGVAAVSQSGKITSGASFEVASTG